MSLYTGLTRASDLVYCVLKDFVGNSGNKMYFEILDCT